MSDAGFDPQALLDNDSARGSFKAQPVYDVFAALIEAYITGALSVPTDAGASQLFLREGQPVGVNLAESYAPLGQLLLELGHIDGATFLRAKPLIEGEGRLSGQVYIQLGAIDNTILTEVLHIQAQRKTRRFVESCYDRFEFARGRQFLTNFVKASIGADLAIFFALEHAFALPDREKYLKGFAGKELCLATEITTPLEDFGFGHAERRFLARLKNWRGVRDLDKFGSLERPEMALILKFLEMRNLMQLRPALDDLAPPEPAPKPEAEVYTAPPAAAQPTPKPMKIKPSKSKKGWTKQEKTERISIAVEGWSEPRPAREERTDVHQLPSILVDYDALGVEPEDDEES